ncbi:tRNA lysidine(34) synthetase TilS [Fodinicurvata halophila]|uniref:tRNA(Ile)-lysidine synthase n=1 Tax=Fodinicurvata halophila TaxID=1419723 RepID=A0ABV8UIR9_9PROT
MAAYAPFEAQARIACAVSGGVDSMALLSLLAPWCRAHGHELMVLHVNHGLRAEADADAAFVMQSAEKLNVQGRVLHWQGQKPSGPVQAPARRARYDLLAGFCREKGILHLAMAHHLDDQSETVALRLQSGSGLAGLAGMASVRYLPDLRLIRPLLGLPKTRLQATLEGQRLDWKEDPSNRNEAHRRVRYRKLLQGSEDALLLGQRLASAAGVYARLRAWSEAEAARLLARAVQVHPAGYALVQAAVLSEAPEWLARRAWFQLLRTIGGSAYGVRGSSLTAYLEAWKATGRMPETLGGCRILPYGAVQFLVVREAQGLRSHPLRPGDTLLWDGRFRFSRARECEDGRELLVGPLGHEGVNRLLQKIPSLRKSRIPRAVWPSFPALFCLDGLLAVPHLNYTWYKVEGKCGIAWSARPYHSLAESVFRPAMSGL